MPKRSPIRRPGPRKATRGTPFVHNPGGSRPDVLSRHAEESLFSIASVLTEGEAKDDTYFGSTMFTIDLAVLSKAFVRSLGVKEKHRLVAAIDGSVRIRLRALRPEACAAAQRRIPHRMLGMASAETRVCVVDNRLYIDVDVEVPVGVARARRPG